MVKLLDTPIGDAVAIGIELLPDVERSQVTQEITSATENGTEVSDAVATIVGRMVLRLAMPTPPPLWRL